MRLDDELRAAAADLETKTSATSPDAGDYLRLARAGTARFTPVELAPGDVRGALTLLHEHIEVDALVPVASTRREVALVKRLLRKLLSWYVGWLAQQVTLLGRAVARFGQAVIERLEQHDRRLDETERTHRRDHDTLAARVAELEAIERRRQRGGL
jgi:hypothetical protein